MTASRPSPSHPVFFVFFLALAPACSSTATIATTDAASDAPLDAPSGDASTEGGDANAPDGGASCKGVDGRCAAGTACKIGSCADGTPLSCMCEPNGALDQCTGACPPAGTDGGADSGAGCTGYGGVVCAPGTACQVGKCADGTPLSCRCEANGGLDACTGACPGPTGVCQGYGGASCAANESCVTGRCPKGTPITCLCQADGTFTACTGACPP